MIVMTTYEFMIYNIIKIKIFKQNFNEVFLRSTQNKVKYDRKKLSTHII